MLSSFSTTRGITLTFFSTLATGILFCASGLCNCGNVE